MAELQKLKLLQIKKLSSEKLAQRKSYQTFYILFFNQKAAFNNC